MTTNIVLDDTWVELDTTHDVLVIGESYKLALGSAAAPASGDSYHLLHGSFLIPTGTGAFISKGNSSVCQASMLGANGDPVKAP